MLTSRVLEMAKMGLYLWKTRHKRADIPRSSSRMSSTPTSPTSPLSPMAQTTEPLYTVTHGYSPKHEGEIKLKPGDMVANVKDLGNGWLLGQNITRDRLGIFPTHCVQTMDTESHRQAMANDMPINNENSPNANQTLNKSKYAVDTNQGEILSSSENPALMSSSVGGSPVQSSQGSQILPVGVSPLNSRRQSGALTYEPGDECLPVNRLPGDACRRSPRGGAENTVNKALHPVNKTHSHSLVHHNKQTSQPATHTERGATPVHHEQTHESPVSSRKPPVDQGLRHHRGTNQGINVVDQGGPGLEVSPNNGHSAVMADGAPHPGTGAQPAAVTSRPHVTFATGVDRNELRNLSSFKPDERTNHVATSANQNCQKINGSNDNRRHNAHVTGRATGSPARSRSQTPTDFSGIRRVIAQKLGPDGQSVDNELPIDNLDNNNEINQFNETVHENPNGQECVIHNRARVPNCLASKPNIGHNHPLISPIYTTVCEAEGLNPETGFYTGSLPQHSTCGRHANTQKPKLIVKPNHTRSMESDDSQSAPAPRPPPSPRGSSPRSSHSRNRSRSRPSPQPPRRSSSNSNQSTPVLPRSRQLDPPRNLPIRDDTYARSQRDGSQERVLEHTSRGIIVTPTPNHPSTPHSCTTPTCSHRHSPQYGYVRPIAPSHSCGERCDENSPVSGVGYDGDEIDNYTNEQRQCYSPANARHVDVFTPHGDVIDGYYGDYRTHKQPPSQIIDKNVRFRQNNIIHKPILKNPKVGDSKGQHIYYRDNRNTKRTSSCFLFSIIGGLFFGVLIFLWMYMQLEYSLLVAMATAVSIATVLMLVFALSRLCRCVAALLFPSLCTTRGRVAFLLIITGMLLGGPVTSIHANMREVSRAMACGAGQTYNLSTALLQPFDAMMTGLEGTVRGLQAAARDVSAGMTPLERGLERVDAGLRDGELQVNRMGTSCRELVDSAYRECTGGITEARTLCRDALEVLGTMYLQTREFLDESNLGRFAPDHVKEQHLHKRQVLLGGTSPTLTDDENEGDICQPLNTISSCQQLNDSGKLCQPSKWAGENIQDALNVTQSSMDRLKAELQFTVDTADYDSARVNATRHEYHVRMLVTREFDKRTQHFSVIISIMKKLFPIAVLLLVYVSYLHVKHYMSRDTYDNNYVTAHFKQLDGKRAEVAGEQLLPLKRYERNYLIDSCQSDLCPPEEGLYSIGLCVVSAHLALSFTCYMFDFILYWILSMIRRYGDPPLDVTGQGVLGEVVGGEGSIAALLQIILNEFHGAPRIGFAKGENQCLPKPYKPDVICLVVIALMYVVLIITILLKAYLLRLRNKLTGLFYPEREKARTVHLYNVILNQRSRMPRLLHARVRMNFRRHQQQRDISLLHKLAARCAPCRVLIYESPRCLVCDAPEDMTSRDCDTEGCGGVYCAPCWGDLHRVCPLCLQGADCEEVGAGGDMGEEEGLEYEEGTYEDDLQPYHRSSKIYL